MAVKVSQGKVATDYKSLTADAQKSYAQASAFGDLPSEHLQHTDSVFANPYRSAGSQPLAVHNLNIARGAMNTGVSHTIIGPTGPNSQPTARLSKSVLQPTRILPPKLSRAGVRAAAKQNPLGGPHGLVRAAPVAPGKSAQGRPGFFPKPTGV